MKTKSKKIILTVVGALMVIISQAQVNFGARLGLTLANQQRVDHEDYYEQSVKGKAKFHIGAFAELPIAENLFAQPGIFLSGKGAEHTSSKTGTATNFKLSYLEFPLNVVYKHNMNFGKIYGGAGPVIGFATKGKLTQNNKTSDMFGDDGDDFKRGDFGFNIMGGVELKNGFLAGISFNTGFVDIYKHEAAKIRNRGFNISFGYLLNHGK